MTPRERRIRENRQPDSPDNPPRRPNYSPLEELGRLWVFIGLAFAAIAVAISAKVGIELGFWAGLGTAATSVPLALIIVCVGSLASNYSRSSQ